MPASMLPRRTFLRAGLTLLVLWCAACEPGAILDPGDDGEGQGSPGHELDAHVPEGAPDGAAAVESDAAAPGDGQDAPVVDASVDEPDPIPTGPTGPSAGCGTAPPATDSTDQWVRHELSVEGVPARYLEGGERYGNQSGFDFTHRNYFVRLPKNYDPTRPYPLVISGGGCGASNGTSGDGGGSNPLSNDQDVAVQVGLSYVYPEGAGACFEDDGADNPDLPYFDTVLAQLDASYCFDRARVFMSGFSSGAWESYMLACARGGVIRGIGTQAGGLREQRPACSNVPVAAFLTAGVNDEANPIERVNEQGFDSGSKAARDVILRTNGCTSDATEPYVTEAAPADWNCLRYTSCPAAYPVVWCAITANGGGHGAGDNKAYWPFWSALPAR